MADNHRDEGELALTHDEALEIVAYLLASAEGLVSEPPGYAFLRLTTAADRLARRWAPRVDGELGAFLSNLGTRMPGEAARAEVDLEGFLSYLGEQIAALARIVKERDAGGGGSDGA